MNLSLASLCVDDGGAPTPTPMVRDDAPLLLERLDEQSALLRGAVEVLGDRLTAIEASLATLHTTLDEATSRCRGEVAELATRTANTRTAVAAALSVLSDSAPPDVPSSARVHACRRPRDGKP